MQTSRWIAQQPSATTPCILALDCSGASCSVAVLRDGRVTAEIFQAMARGQAEALLPMVEAAMREAGLAFADLTAIATTTGPGSFTGLRIGIAAARALAFATKARLVGVTAFQAVWQGLPLERQGQPVAVLIDSRRGSLFGQLFAADGAALTPPDTIEPGALSEWLPRGGVALAGDGVALLPREDQATHAATNLIRACFVAELALKRLQSGSALEALVPLYLRPPDVTLKPTSPLS